MDAISNEGPLDGPRLGEIPADVAEVLSNRGAKQINLYRALSHSPEIVRAWLDFIWTLRDDCLISRSLRELVILRTALRHDSSYEWHHHVLMAEAVGVTAKQIAELPNWSESSAFNGLERAALELTDAICDGSVPPELRAAAASWFNEREYVEIVVTAAAYVMVPRVLAALAVPMESDMEVGDSDA
jgi:alkylhydroperoxidase family enzyme